MRFISVDAKTKRRTIVIVSLCFLLLIMYWSSPSEPAVYPVVGSHEPVDRVDISGEKIALTFNIAWGDETFSEVLDVLDEQGVKSTFFVAGPWAETNRPLVERASEDGHEIATMGYRQLDLTTAEDETMREEISKGVQVLKDRLQQSPRLFRPPTGQWDDRVMNAATELGLVTVTASLDSRDWTNPGVEQIVDNVLTDVQPGFLIEFHADDSSTQLAEALPIIIKQLHEEGFELITVSQLLGIADTIQ